MSLSRNSSARSLLSAIINKHVKEIIIPAKNHCERLSFKEQKKHSDLMNKLEITLSTAQRIIYKLKPQSGYVTDTKFNDVEFNLIREAYSGYIERKRMKDDYLYQLELDTKINLNLDTADMPLEQKVIHDYVWAESAN